MLDVFYILIASGFIPLVIFFIEKGLGHNDQALEVGGFIRWRGMRSPYGSCRPQW